MPRNPIDLQPTVLLNLFNFLKARFPGNRTVYDLDRFVVTLEVNGFRAAFSITFDGNLTCVGSHGHPVSEDLTALGEIDLQHDRIIFEAFGRGGYYELAEQVYLARLGLNAGRDPIHV